MEFLRTEIGFLAVPIDPVEFVVKPRSGFFEVFACNAPYIYVKKQLDVVLFDF